LPSEKDYINTFTLDYVFVGHSKNILEIFYLKMKNLLITTSSEGMVKIWSMEKGISLYNFNIDSNITKILYYTEKKNEYIVFICKESFKIKVNISKEPFCFTTNPFAYNKILNSELIENKFYLLGLNSNIYIFDNMMNFQTEITEEQVTGGILFLAKWKNYFITLGEDKLIKLVEINESVKKIKVLFQISIGTDFPSCLKLITNSSNPKATCLIGNMDNKVYKLDIEEEYNLYRDRIKMIEEEKMSIAYNNYLRIKSTKKKKPTSSKKKKGLPSANSKSKERIGTASSKKSIQVTKSEASESSRTVKSVKSVKTTKTGKKTSSKMDIVSNKPNSGKSQRSISASSARSGSVEDENVISKEDMLPVIKEEKGKKSSNKSKSKSKTSQKSKSVAKTGAKSKK
jgi:hypothetical protein